MLNGRPVLQVIQDGVSFTCAHCVKFWWGIDNEAEGCKAKFEGKECAGPISGLAFPEYEGPLEGNQIHFCFMCGKKPDAAAVAKNAGGKRLGICKECAERCRSLSRPCHKPPFITDVYLPTLER